MQGQPHEHERRPRVRRELPSLAAVAVREPREAPLVDAAQQHDASVGLAVLVNRRERHRVRLLEPGGGSVVIPTLELDDGIRGEVVKLEALGLVLVPEGFDVPRFGEQLQHPGPHSRKVGSHLHEHQRADSFALAEKTEEDVLGADVVVLECQCLAKRQLEHLLRAGSERDVSRRLRVPGSRRSPRPGGEPRRRSLRRTPTPSPQRPRSPGRGRGGCARCRSSCGSAGALLPEPARRLAWHGR